VNRQHLIDSKLSLDLRRHPPDDPTMKTQSYKIYCERHDPDRNMARFYSLEIAPDLFGQPCLIRSWGRIGKRGQCKQHPFADEAGALTLFLALLRQKKGRGYRPPPPGNSSKTPSVDLRSDCPTTERQRHY
jgi:predicted DNA-binding WGR domain protein